jgi:beta-glucanase (GH16 family)
MIRHRGFIFASGMMLVIAGCQTAQRLDLLSDHNEQASSVPSAAERSGDGSVSVTANDAARIESSASTTDEDAGEVPEPNLPRDAETTIEPPPPPPPEEDAGFDGGAATDAAPPEEEDAGPVEPPPPPEHCTLAGPPTTPNALVWNDEFNGDAVDTSKWRIHNGYGGHGTIVSRFSPSAASVHDGSLHVTASYDPAGDPDHPYTSARIDSFGRFARTYGRLEFRARFAHAPGVWYAIWGRPSNNPLPELDVEVLGKAPTKLWFVNHWDLPPLPPDDRRKFVTPATDITQFHIFAITWRENSLVWTLDGVPYMESTSTSRGVPSSPVAWTINGWVGGWGASPTEAPVVPAEFEVDWIRAFRLDGLIAPPVLRVSSPIRAQYAKKDIIDVEIANFDEACFRVEVKDENGVALATHYSSDGITLPYRFRLNALEPGAHTLTFVATDGQREASTSLSFELR